MSKRNLVQQRQHWNDIILDWQDSGLSQVNYCRKHNLKPHQFNYYKGLVLTPKMEPSLVPVATALPLPVTSSTITAILPDGIRLEVPSDQALTLLPNLIATLRAAL